MSNLSNVLEVRRRGEVQVICDSVLQFKAFPAVVAELAWERFSSSRYCAQWIDVSAEHLEEFKKWIEE